MADMTFNTTEGSVVERKLLILYLNTGTSTEPTWSVIGRRVEDSSMEYDWSEETKQARGPRSPSPLTPANWIPATRHS